MFETIEEVMATVRSMSEDELAQLVVLAMTEEMAGKITRDQAGMVVAVVLGVMIERELAQQELAEGATVN